MAEEPASDDVAALRATAHPIRLRMLSLLTGTSMSASEVARELDITQANASYHLRVLAKAGELVEAGEEKVRGGVAKKYRHPWREVSERPSRHMPREAYLKALGAELVRRDRERRPDAPSLSGDAEMWVPPEVWTEVMDLVRRAATLVHDEAQPPRTQGTVHVNLTLAAFQMNDPETWTEGEQ